MELLDALRKLSTNEVDSEEEQFLRNARYYNDYFSNRFEAPVEIKTIPSTFRRKRFEEKRRLFDIEFPHRVSPGKLQKGREALKMIAENRERYFPAELFTSKELPTTSQETTEQSTTDQSTTPSKKILPRTWNFGSELSSTESESCVAGK